MLEQFSSEFRTTICDAFQRDATVVKSYSRRVGVFLSCDDTTTRAQMIKKLDLVEFKKR